jgi:hypothetical protein
MITTTPERPRCLLTRRRQLAAAGVVVVLASLLAGWYRWEYLCLTAEERALVGTWQHNLTGKGWAPPGWPSETEEVYVFRSDRSCSSVFYNLQTGEPFNESKGHWAVRDGRLCFKTPLGWRENLGQLVRTVLQRLGKPPPSPPAGLQLLSVTADRFVLQRLDDGMLIGLDRATEGWRPPTPTLFEQTP